jgi:hypothetical protein
VPSQGNLLDWADKALGQGISTTPYMLLTTPIPGTAVCVAAPGQGGIGVPSQGNLLDWADKALGQGISSVTRSVKNLLSGARQAPVAAALEALMDGKQVRRESCCDGGGCLLG